MEPKTNGTNLLRLVTEDGVRRLLAGHFIKGVGNVFADRIVGRFGMEILKPEFDWLTALREVPGLGENKIKEIVSSLESLKISPVALGLLYSAGLSNREVEKIASHYKGHLMDIIVDDPYDMVENVWKTSFFTADKIGRFLGVDKNDARRIRGAVLTAIKFYAEKGNVYATERQVIHTAAALCDITETAVKTQIDVLADEGRLIKSFDSLYLPVYYIAEKEAAQKLGELVRFPALSEVSFDIPQEDINGNRFTVEQKRAIESVRVNPVTIITGGPGTGKTTTIRGLVRLFEDMGKKVILAAPTGRSAKRMSDLSGMEAKTIHRLLGYSMGRGYRNKSFDADVLIVDEASMLEQVLFNHLLQAMKKGTRVVLVGDTNQLPPIGAGDVLNQIIASETVPVIQLTENFRQSEGSDIARTAEHIRRGEIPDDPGNRDFMLIKETGDSRILKKILNLIGEEIPALCEIDPKDIQVVTPQQEGPLGAKALNFEIQETVNPGAPEIKRGTKRLRLGDRVMQIANDSNKSVYNGETGWISGLDPQTQSVEVTFYDGKKIKYDKRSLKNLALAYAITVHKLQGSETDYMILLMSDSHRQLLYRNLLYTGVSRAKKLCVLLGESRAITRALDNDGAARRNSNFKERLRKNISGT